MTDGLNPMLPVWTVNAVSNDGRSFPIYFECNTEADVRAILTALNIRTDMAGICRMVAAGDWNPRAH